MKIDHIFRLNNILIFYSTTRITLTMFMLDKMDRNELSACGKSGKLEMYASNSLGFGSMGTCVYKGLYENSTDVAIKVIPKCVFKGLDKKIVDANDINEVTILKKFQHPNLVKYHIFEYDVTSIYIALELCEGTLIDFVANLSGYTLDEQTVVDFECKSKKFLLYGIVQGLDELHTLNIVHGDLKPQNILFKKIYPNEYGMRFKAVISDFGLSLQIEPGRRSKTVADGKIGTQGWRSKELIIAIENAENESKTSSNSRSSSMGDMALDKDQEISKVKGTKSNDIFALGCIIHYVLNGRAEEWTLHPFGNDLGRDSNIKKGQHIIYLSNKRDKRLDEVLADMLIEICISDVPDSRPGTKEINKHPFFWNPKERYRFIEQISNDSNHLDKAFKKMLEKTWNKYHPFSFEGQLKPKVTQEVLECIKGVKTPEKKFDYRSKSLIQLVKIIRNTKTHYEEKKKKVPKITEVLNNGTEDDFERYFLNNIVAMLPVLYTCFYKCPENKQDGFQSYFERQGFHDHSVRFDCSCKALEKIFIFVPKDGSNTRKRARSRAPSSETQN